MTDKVAAFTYRIANENSYTPAFCRNSGFPHALEFSSAVPPVQRARALNSQKARLNDGVGVGKGEIKSPNDNS